MSDHSADIEDMRGMASDFLAKARRSRTSRGRTDNNAAANVCLAVAALLEVHDMTGISLDNWRGPREFVEDCIGHPITENGA